MAFDTRVVPWIDEIQNYLRDDTKKTSELKKVLKNADLEKLTYADKSRLFKMFDPKCEISEELFKRQLNLYFSLLESKSSPIKIPIFSEYVEWLYSQDVKKMGDRTFDALTSRLLKTTATELSEPIMSFMDRLPEAFDRDIDRTSNQRISSLINILNELKMDYFTMPEECKKFVRDMFKSCAVKTEIADKNKDRVRRLFKQDPRYYYNIFNKAFAGFSEYETWIDEPAKKITFQTMINYANFQDRVLANYKKPLTFAMFTSYARELGLPRLPEYDTSLSNFSQYYLRQPREYKDYAKKMGPLFVGLVRDELARVEKLLDEKHITTYDLYDFASTRKSKTDVGMLNMHAPKSNILMEYSEFLIDLVHLDELTGQSYRDIYNTSHMRDTQVAKPASVAPVAPKVESRDGERYYPVYKRAEVLGQCSLFDYVSSPSESHESVEDYIEPLDRREYTVEDLPELYERYNELQSSGREDYALAELIVSLEDKRRDQMQEKVFGEEE